MVARGKFTSSGAVPISPAIHSAWERTSATFFRAPLNFSGTNLNTTRTSFVCVHGNAGGTDDVCQAQFVSPLPLNVDQTITGNFDIVVGGFENAASDNLYLAVVVRIIKPDGSERGVLKVQTTNTGGSEYGTADRTRIWALSLTTVSGTNAALAGDYIVVETGSHSVSAGASAQLTLWFGDPTGAADSALTSGIVSTNVHWCEFSQTLTFGVPVPTLTPTPATSPIVAPDVTVAMQLTLTPSAADTPIVAPSVALAMELSLAPTPATAQLVVPDPTVVQAGGGQTMTPDPALVTLAVPDPTLALVLELAPTSATSPIVAPPVTLALALTLSPDPAEAALAVPAPTLVFELVLTPDPAVCELAAPAAALAMVLELVPLPATTPINVGFVFLAMELVLTPDPAVFVLDVPSVSAGGVVFITPAAAALVLEVPAASVVATLVLTPGPALVALVSPSLALVELGPAPPLGDLVLVPAAAVFQLVAPSVVLGHPPPTRRIGCQLARRILIDRWPPHVPLAP